MIVIIANETVVNPIIESIKCPNTLPNIRGFGGSVTQGGIGNHDAVKVIGTRLGKANVEDAVRVAVSDLKADVVINIGTALALKDDLRFDKIYEVSTYIHQIVGSNPREISVDSLLRYAERGTEEEIKEKYPPLKLVSYDDPANFSSGARETDVKGESACDAEFGIIAEKCCEAKIPVYGFKMRMYNKVLSLLRDNKLLYTPSHCLDEYKIRICLWSLIENIIRYDITNFVLKWQSEILTCLLLGNSYLLFVPVDV